VRLGDSTPAYGTARNEASGEARFFVGDRASGTRKEREMSRGYGALRLWATVLAAVGIAGVILVVIGTIFAMIEAVTFGQALAILLIGGPLAALFASWPIALGQGLRALADVAESVQRQQGVPAERLSEGEKAPRD
jgi:hypothetical protein